MKKYFCSADIHSFFDEWMFALEDRGFDKNNPEHIVLVCGDLFDRGNQSVECYKFAQTMFEQNRFVYIRGNHEDLLEELVHCLSIGLNLGHHHVTNGTVRTISHFLECSEYDILCNCYDNTKFNKSMNRLLTFIDKAAMDYYELGDKVFVHGWIPFDARTGVQPDWRHGDWNKSRWCCGFDCWSMDLIPPENLTVVCGHWHNSYAWHKFRGRSEWGPDAEFSTFSDKNIIGLDACTVRTHMINVIIVDEEGNVVE